MELKYKIRGVYIRNVGNNYYAYRTRSKRMKEEKSTKTLPFEYLGVVTRNGILRNDQVMRIRPDYEYGNIALLYAAAEKTILPVLKEVKCFTYLHSLPFLLCKNYIYEHPFP